MATRKRPTLKIALPRRVRVVIRPTDPGEKSESFTIYDISPAECRKLLIGAIDRHRGKRPMNES